MHGALAKVRALELLTGTLEGEKAGKVFVLLSSLFFMLVDGNRRARVF